MRGRWSFDIVFLKLLDESLILYDECIAFFLQLIVFIAAHLLALFRFSELLLAVFKFVLFTSES